MHDRHTNKARYFKEQVYTTQKYVIPYMDQCKPVAGTRVLEIGCGEGGNLEPFLDAGCECVGVDLSPAKIKVGQELFSEHERADHITFLCEDIYESDKLGTFDWIFLRDVIEHIHDQERFMAFVKKFLKPGGKIFFGFPPWYSPFGGHQQICYSKFLSKLPYFHVLPMFMYKGILKLFKEPEKRIEDLVEIKETGISIDRFERILRKEGYKIDKRTLYFINPNYEIKFKLKPRKQIGLINAIPYVRNYWITCGYYVVSLPD